MNEIEGLPNYFQIAKVAALHSNFENRYKMGAVIVKNKSVIGIGFNQLKTHPIYNNGEKFFSIHAEMSAIIHSTSKIKGCSIYIFRMANIIENKKHKIMPAIAKPCENCLPILIESGISRIYYTIPESPFYIMEKI